MIQWKTEGSTLLNGLSVYKPNDKSSAGFVLRYGPCIPATKLGSKVFWFRYSKVTGRWIIGKGTQ